ncbi:putative thiazole-containing bacteriocin maturation protein [Brevibacillus sp. GCM10020057]|uniref:putative thiazole-containing bacteriocin maturation protein n=1 Tax=Brevibacillus sp. GCM10020057 TaxID=3317327 RepID=UPI00363C3A2A
MAERNPSLRPKVKRDTFYLPSPDGSVYFRNNTGSFRMEGGMIDQWIEKLLPMFTGEYTLGELTDGLPDEYRDRVFEIAESLLRNGFARDVSGDRPHSLTDEVCAQYGPQIEFLGNLADSGAYRFMRFRQSKVVAAGAGPFLVALVGALLDSGLSRFHLLITEEQPTNRKRVAELIAHARSRDPEVAVEELAWRPEREGFWREAVRPFEAILYVSQTGNVELVRQLQADCREEGKQFLPAVAFAQAGLVGPLAGPDSAGSWESAWRRLHRSVLAGKDQQLCGPSATALAMLANVAAFEWLKKAAGVTAQEGEPSLFVLDMETLEGSWHTYLPHPLAVGLPPATPVADIGLHLEADGQKREPGGLIPFFSTLVSQVTGVFHRWEEGELIQLPLSQCFIQAVDPLGDGPADLLPERIYSGMTHEEARTEAGLAGIEAYAARLVEAMRAERCAETRGRYLAAEPGEFVGVGAGETAAEGVCRALQQCLAAEWQKQLQGQIPLVLPVLLERVEDAACRYYLQALATMQAAPKVGLGAELYGLPVVWVEVGGIGCGSAGVSVTDALKKALQLALLREQNGEMGSALYAGKTSALRWAERASLHLDIPACEEGWHREAVLRALQTLQQHGKRFFLWELALEPVWQGELGGVYGAVLREEESG